MGTLNKGVVSKLSEKDWSGPQGSVILHSFQLEGNRAYFRTGKQSPTKFGIVPGAAVSFFSDEKGNVDYKSVQKVAESEVQRAPTPRTGGASVVSSGGSRDGYWEAKEARDIAKDAHYQSVDIPRMTYCGAQDVAVKVVELAIANGGITIPAKKGAILDVITGAVDAVALTLAKARMDAPKALSSGASTDSNVVPEEEDIDAGYDDV